jgi:hypothetical protein
MACYNSHRDTVASAYNHPVRRELKYAMDAAGSTQNLHHLGILMSPSGRFLECLNCRVRIEFPKEVHFETVSKQFASHPCSSPPRQPPGRRTDQ